MNNPEKLSDLSFLRPHISVFRGYDIIREVTCIRISVEPYLT